MSAVLLAPSQNAAWAADPLWRRARQRPSFDVDFTTGRFVDRIGNITPAYSRTSSSKLAWNGSTFTTYAADTPAFQWDAASGRWGYLHEPAATNLALYSGAVVANTGWSHTNVTTATSGTGLDGASAYEMTETTANGVHVTGNTGSTTAASGTSVTSGTTYTGSVFLKRSSVDWVQLTMGAAGFGTSVYANFNLATGAVGNSAGMASGTTPRIQAFGDGWYRCTISATATATSAATNNLLIGFTNNADAASRLPSYTGSTSNKVLLAMLQFETGTVATSYVGTTASTVTRSADLMTVSGADFSRWYDQRGLTLFAEVTPYGINSQNYVAAISNGASFANSHLVFANNGVPRAESWVSSSAQSNISQGSAWTAGTRQLFASTMAANSFDFCRNGTLGTPDTSGSVPTVDRLAIGSSFNNLLQLNGLLFRIACFPPGPAQTRLQELTRP